jgi:hypothetical protein
MPWKFDNFYRTSCMIINQTIFIFNLKNYEKMFNIKIVWFIIMHDVQQKLSNFHGILHIAFYYLVS